MKHLVAVALIFTLTTTVVVAQNEKMPSSGSVGLIFEIAGLGQFNLSGPVVGSTTLLPLSIPFDSIFQDLLGGFALPVYGIGAKVYVSDHIALRGSLGLNYSSETNPRTTIDTAGNLVVVDDTDNMFVGAVSPGFEYHFPPAGPISGYVGAMLSFSSGVKTTGPNDGQKSDRSSSFMIGPILGAEFYPWDNVSLGAEYVLGYSSTSTSQKVGDTVTNGVSYSSIGTGNFAVRASLYIK